jgi:nucleoside-diphosphate-sugar epimerase
MRVLVTGASGFLGRHLVRHLAARSCTVLAVTRTPLAGETGTPIAWQRIGHLDGQTDWSPWLRGMDAVVHLAGVAHRANEASAAYTAELERVNVQGTVRLHAQCGLCGVGHFIFVSSLAAVTSRSLGRIDDATPSAPTTPYGHSKWRAEQALISARSVGGADYTILRPPLIYGAGNPANMARLVHLVRSGLPLPFGSLCNQRSFMFVGNLCDAIYHCLHASAARNQTFFVSDNRDLSTPELIRLIAQAGGWPCRLVPFPTPILEALARLNPDGSIAKLVGSLYLDVSPIKAALAWLPPFTVESGLRETLA